MYVHPSRSLRLHKEMKANGVPWVWNRANVSPWGCPCRITASLTAHYSSLGSAPNPTPLSSSPGRRKQVRRGEGRPTLSRLFCKRQGQDLKPWSGEVRVREEAGPSSDHSGPWDLPTWDCTPLQGCWRVPRGSSSVSSEPFFPCPPGGESSTRVCACRWPCWWL